MRYFCYCSTILVCILLLLSCERKKIDGHIVISVQYERHDIFRRSPTMRQAEGITRFAQANVASMNMYSLLRSESNIDRNQISGVSYNTLSTIKDKIPSKYIWIHSIITYRPNTTTIKIVTPGSNTSWSDLSFKIYGDGNLDYDNLSKNVELPSFKIIKRNNEIVFEDDIEMYAIRSLKTLGNLKDQYSAPIPEK